LVAIDQDKETCNNRNGHKKIIEAPAKIFNQLLDLCLYGTIDPGIVKSNMSLAK